MEVSYQSALEYFARFNPGQQAPSLHPQYVQADALRQSHTKDGELQPTFFVFQQDEHIWYHGFHVSQVPDTPYYDIQSPYGYGGPLATTSDSSFLTAAQTAYQSWCREQSVLAEFIRFHPLLENWHYFHGDIILDRQTVWVDLQVDNLLKHYASRTTGTIKKAIKSDIQIHWYQPDKFLEIFPELYNQAMQDIGATDFYTFPHDYHAALAHSSPNFLGVCLQAGQVIAAAIFLASAEILEYHLSAASLEGKKSGSVCLLLHEAFARAKEHGLKRAHLGGGTNATEENPLFFFKSGFSQKRSSFRIGKRIHLAEEYKRLQDVWQENKGSVNSKILFYRD